MNNDNILLLTKDAFCKDYLPAYGNAFWKNKTPNIDELQKKGTIYTHFYTAAPSTVMSFRSMMFGKFPHETPYSNYTPKNIPDEDSNFLVLASSMGYKCHIIWDSTWVKMVLRYGNCFGPNTEIHNIDNLKQGVGAHYNHKDTLVRNDDKCIKAISDIKNIVEYIESNNQKSLVWIHLPHVINGRVGYGDDIDVFDECIGMLRKYFSDENIFISADHGNMNGFMGKYCYGFDLYRTSIEIPLISPKINNMSVCNDFISNVDIKDIVLKRFCNKRDFIFSDTAYYAQPQRKIAIIHDGFMYIYSKMHKTEELYDLIYSPNYERCNMIFDYFYDSDRHVKTRTREVFFSPRWDQVEYYKDLFRNKLKEIWKNGPAMTEFKEKVYYYSKNTYIKAKSIFHK